MYRYDPWHSNSDEFNEKIKKLEFVYAEIKRVFDKQWEATDIIDSKAGNLIGFLGVIISLSFGLLSSRNLKLISHDCIIFFGFVVILLGIIILFVSLICVFWTIKVRKFKIAPEPRKFWNSLSKDNQVKEPYHKILTDMIPTTIKTYEENEKHIQQKEKFLNLAVCSLLVGLFLIFLGVLIFK